MLKETRSSSECVYLYNLHKYHNYSRLGWTNQVASVDSTNVLDTGVASPLFPEASLET